jgi:hypothetical protein
MQKLKTEKEGAGACTCCRRMLKKIARLFIDKTESKKKRQFVLKKIKNLLLLYPFRKSGMRVPELNW